MPWHQPSRTERVWPVTAKEQAVALLTGCGKRGGTAAGDLVIGRPRAESSLPGVTLSYPRPAADGSPPSLSRRALVSPTSRRASSRSGRATRPSRRRSISVRDAPSGSSTTARRSRTACRTTGTCSPAMPRISSRATRRCAASRCTAASVGTLTGCRPSWRRCVSWASPARRRSSRWASRSSTPPPAIRCCATRRSGRVTSPARRAGSTSRTTTRRSTRTSWSRSCGRSSACTTRPRL